MVMRGLVHCISPLRSDVIGAEVRFECGGGCVWWVAGVVDVEGFGGGGAVGEMGVGRDVVG